VSWDDTGVTVAAPLVWWIFFRSGTGTKGSAVYGFLPATAVTVTGEVVCFRAAYRQARYPGMSDTVYTTFSTALVTSGLVAFVVLIAEQCLTDQREERIFQVEKTQWEIQKNIEKAQGDSREIVLLLSIVDDLSGAVLSGAKGLKEMTNWANVSYDTDTNGQRNSSLRWCWALSAGVGWSSRDDR